MCEFFSFVTKGSKKYYFDWQQRQEFLKSNPKGYRHDSHASICDFYKINEDRVNKYEYNPLTKVFKVDQINIKDDRALAKKWVEGLDFKTIVEPLIIKDTVHPFEIDPPEKVLNFHLELLKQWASVWDSVRDSVWASVRGSVWDSVRDSVWDSVWAYTSTFFNIEKWKYVDHKKGENPFQPCIDLWELGLVPSYDGEVWRLHSKNGIEWEGKIN